MGKESQQYHFWIKRLYYLIMKVLKLWKRFEIFQSSFHVSNLKNWSPKKIRLLGIILVYNPNQFMAFQNLFYNFIVWIFNVIFSPKFSVFEVHFQEPSTLVNQDLHKILNRKIIIIQFQNWILMLKLDFKRLFKNINFKK